MEKFINVTGYIRNPFSFFRENKSVINYSFYFLKPEVSGFHKLNKQNVTKVVIVLYSKYTILKSRNNHNIQIRKQEIKRNLLSI